MATINKLYVVVRQDLSPGAQIAQSLHAFREFINDYPEEEMTWFTTSNTIVILGCQNKEELESLAYCAGMEQINHSIFCEPDMNNELTAVAFEPGEKTSLFLSHLKTAGRSVGTEILDK